MMMKNVSRSQIIQKQKQNKTLKCSKPSHNESVLKYVCTASNCDQDFLCDLCLQRDHPQSHQENVILIDDLLISDLGKNPIKKIKVESTVKKIDPIKDIIAGKSSTLKAYSQAIREEFQKMKEQVLQVEEIFKQFIATLKKKLEVSCSKLLKDLKTQFNIFEYSALRVPHIRKEIENLCLKDSQEYKSIITSIIELEKGQNENTPEFMKQLGESFSLEESSKLLMKTANARPVSSDNIKLLNRLEHELLILQQNILEGFPQEKRPNKETIKKEMSLSKLGNKIFDFAKANQSNSVISQNRITALTIVEPTKIALGTETGFIEYWNLSNQMIIQKVSAHSAVIKGLLSTNRKTIVSGSRDNFIKVFRLPNLQCIQTINAHLQGLNSISKIENSDVIVSGGMDNLWKVWDTSTGKMLFSKPAAGVNCVQVLHSSARDKITWENKLHMPESTKESFSAVAIGGKKDIYVWVIDTIEGREPYQVYTMKGHEKEIRSITTVNGNILISAGNDFSIRIWDLKDGSCKKVIQKAHEKFITQVGFVENDVFVSCGLDGAIKFWNITKGSELKSFEYHKGFIYCLEFDGQGGMITAGEDQIVRIWK